MKIYDSMSYPVQQSVVVSPYENMYNQVTSFNNVQNFGNSFTFNQYNNYPLGNNYYPNKGNNYLDSYFGNIPVTDDNIVNNIFLNPSIGNNIYYGSGHNYLPYPPPHSPFPMNDMYNFIENIVRESIADHEEEYHKPKPPLLEKPKELPKTLDGMLNNLAYHSAKNPQNLEFGAYDPDDNTFLYDIFDKQFLTDKYVDFKDTLVPEKNRQLDKSFLKYDSNNDNKIGTDEFIEMLEDNVYTLNNKIDKYSVDWNIDIEPYYYSDPKRIYKEQEINDIIRQLLLAKGDNIEEELDEATYEILRTSNIDPRNGMNRDDFIRVRNILIEKLNTSYVG